MNPERQELLDDILRDDGSSYEAALERMLHHVQRRKRSRFAARSVVAALVLALPMIALLRNHSSRTAPTSVAERPLPARSSLQIVETHGASVPMVFSSPTTVTMVETPVASVDEVTDERLIDMVAPSGAVIVWHAPHQAELVLASSAEQR